MSVEKCQPKKAEDFENNQPKMSLDEVITQYNFCLMLGLSACGDCRYRDADGVCRMRENALHYLKNYRDTKEWLDLEKRNYAEAIKNCERAEAKYTQMTLDMNRNVPLTWGELKSMVGNPVWVEDNLETPEDITKYWAIMWRVEKAEDDEYALLSDFYYQKSQYGETWQAYRKERE